MPGRSLRLDSVTVEGASSAGSGNARPGATSGPAPLALYETSVRHSRSGPIRHDVYARSYWWLVDVDQLQVDGRGVAGLPGFPAWTTRLASIRPADLDIGSVPSFGAALRRKVAELAARENSQWDRTLDVEGPALLACTGRVAGAGFDPLSVVWLHSASGEPVAVLAVVRNTYGGLHHYLLRPDARGRAEVPKSFMVSPFHDGEGRYVLDVPPPGDELYVGIRLEREGEPDFLASVSGTKQAATPKTLIGLALRRPIEPVAVSAKIRAHGVYLWARGLRVHPVPESDTSAGREAPGVPPAPRGPVTAMFALGTKWILAAVAGGMSVRIEYPDGRVRGAGRHSPNAPRMIIHRPSEFHSRVGRHASIGLGESYMAGEWTSPDMPALLAEFADRQATLVPRPLRILRGLYIPRPPRATDGDKANARRNISSHYDLSNAFFALFLDETMTYSSALFPAVPRRRGQLAEDGGPTSHEAGTPTFAQLAPAQEAKIDALLDAAGVRAGTRLLEIGTGWGELCLRAARRGAQVVSVTLSEAQRELAQRRADDAGLGESVAVQLCDYRDVEGEFDAVISVEMIEAVGLEYLGEYFAAIDRVLAPGGKAALQAILMDDERVRTTRNNYTWMHKYIFPGGRIPSIEAIEGALDRTRLRLGARTHFGLHYAETLRLWEDRFTARAGEVRDLGFDDTFVRMWRFYLQYCEAGFRSGYLDVAQLVVERDR